MSAFASSHDSVPAFAEWDGALGFHAAGAEGRGPLLEGDFYSDGPTTRGVVLAVNSDEVGCPPPYHADQHWAKDGLGASAFGCGSAYYSDPGDAYGFGAILGEPFPVKPGKRDGLCADGACGDPGLDGIASGPCEPPLEPTDPLFALEATFLRIFGASAEAIMRACLDFFRARSDAVLLQVDGAAGAVKARVLTEAGSCTVQATLYRAAGFGGQEHLLEFHRCHGDSVLFHQLFRRAAEFHQARHEEVKVPGGFADVGPSASFGLPEAPPPFFDDSEDEAPLDPLLDGMLPPAEVAAALAAVAKTACPVQLAGDRRVVETVRQLLLSSDPEVAYPAACLAQGLLRRGGAAAAAALLPLVSEALRAGGACAAVRRELELAAAEAHRGFPA